MRCRACGPPAESASCRSTDSARRPASPSKDANHPALAKSPSRRSKVVTHDYFKAMGIPLLRGRLFDSRDTAPNTRRVIVSETLVKKYFGDSDPIGQRIVLVVEQRGTGRDYRRRRRRAIGKPRDRAAWSELSATCSLRVPVHECGGQDLEMTAWVSYRR